MSQVAMRPGAGAAVPGGQSGGAAAPGEQGARAAGNYKWWVLITVVFGAFVSILDNTIVNTAIPKLQAVFGADTHEISYVATGYTLAQGVIVPATAFLAARFGIKRIYLGSLTLFTIGSALCGLAPSTSAMIFFRVLQGAGGAALFPLSFAILFSVFPPEERGRANGFFGIPVLFAPAIGPTVGGYIVQYFDWRWIFYVNVPIGIVGVLVGRAVLREVAPRTGLRFDIPGFVFAALGFGLLLYGLSNLAYDGFQSVSTVSGPVAIAVVLLIIWIAVELRVKQPLLDLRLFKRRNYWAGNVITSLGTIGIFGPAFLLPQYLQNLRGLDPFPSGVLLFTAGVGTVMGTILAGQLFNRIGARALIIIGSLLTITSSWLLAGWSTVDSPYSALPWFLLLRGIGLPFFLQSANTSALDGITGRALPGATTLNVVGRNVVAALSIATLLNILQNKITIHRFDLASTFSLTNPVNRLTYNNLVTSLIHSGTPAAQAGRQAIVLLQRQLGTQAAALGYQDIYYLTAIITIPVIVLAFLIRPPQRTRQQQGGRAHMSASE